MNSFLSVLMSGWFGCALSCLAAEPPPATPAPPVQLLIGFNAYDGKVDQPEKMSFLLTKQEGTKRNEFLKLGEQVSVGNARFTLARFQQRKAPGPEKGRQEDVTQLTLVETTGNRTVQLILGRMVDISPASEAPK